jgi:hypothetical protein
VAIITPDYFAIYGSAKIPEPIAVASRASTLPLSDPGVNLLNHLCQQVLLSKSQLFRKKYILILYLLFE